MQQKAVCQCLVEKNILGRKYASPVLAVFVEASTLPKLEGILNGLINRIFGSAIFKILVEIGINLLKLTQ